MARSTFSSQNAQNAVALSTFSTQNVRNTFSDHFLKLRCREMARRCGAKPIFKSKCTKHTKLGAFFEAQMSKNNTHGCGAKHIFKSRCTKHNARTTFSSCTVKKLHPTVARSTFPAQKAQNTLLSDHFLKLGSRKKDR